jgi:hypothetical protein
MTIDGVWIGECIDWQIVHNDFVLRAITAPPLITINDKSPQHPLSLFQPAVSSPAVPWQHLVTVEIFQLHMLTPFRAGRRLTIELSSILSLAPS